MKTLLLITVMAIFVTSSSHSQHAEHVQDVHKYITYQAWELVKSQYPGVVNSEMNRRIGHWQDGSINGTGPWQKGMVITGAFREDEEDVVYGYPFPYTSATHFWDADLGDNSIFNPPPHNRNYENAYRKLQSYWTGKDGNRNWLEIGPFFYNLIPYYIRVSYDSLHNAYKDHSRFVVTHWLDIGTGNWYAEEPPMPMVPFLVKNSNSYSFAEGDALAKRICWEIVGRMTHLIEDSGIPAHAHNDIHLFGDYFETDYIPQVFQSYTWENALQQGGLININSKAYPLRYALYTTNQIADRFSSDDFDGDANLVYHEQYNGEGYSSGIAPYYQTINSSGIHVSTPPIFHAHIAANTLFVYTIRSVAGFLWYVYNKFGITTDTPPDITGFTYNHPDQFVYAGETLELTCNATGTNLNYEWTVKVCDTNSLCNRSIPGLSYTSTGNTIRITNNYFRNEWTCLKYDSACGGGGSRLAEDPLHLYVGVKVYNNAGSVRKYYRPERLTSIHPNSHLRPGPFSGCPVVMTHNGMKFVPENNILHKSEFPENKDKDITDKLVLMATPAVNQADSTITIAIDENSIDISYFDSFSLCEVIHPDSRLLAVTDEGAPVLIDTQNICSPFHAEHEGEDVTDILNYDPGNGKSVDGWASQYLTSKFDCVHQPGDSIAVIFDAAPPPKPVIPIVKDAAGLMTMYNEDGSFNQTPFNFAIRQNPSQTVVANLNFGNIVFAEMQWKREFRMSYFAIAPVSFSGFDVTTYDMTEAHDINSGNVLQLLLHDDNTYAVLDSSTSLILKFKVKFKVLPHGSKRSYMFIANGRYLKPAGFNEIKDEPKGEDITRTVNENETALLPNYPNPFNPQTNVRLFLKEDAITQVSVFDIAGRQVRELFNGQLSSGYHKFIFDGTSLPSGAYYIKLRAHGRTHVRKVLLIK